MMFAAAARTMAPTSRRSWHNLATRPHQTKSLNESTSGEQTPEGTYSSLTSIKRWPDSPRSVSSLSFTETKPLPGWSH
jgi:hypothetical protein